MSPARKKPPAKKAAKKPRPRKPSVQGKRGDRAIDRQEGLRALIDEWLREVPKPTYNEMLDRLKGTGYYISRSALARYGFEFEIFKQDLRQTLEKAKLLRTEDPDDVLALEDAITHVLNTRFLEGLLGTDETAKPLTKEELQLAFAHAKLQSSSAQRERTRLAVTRGINAAVRLIRAELTELLKSDEKLLSQVLGKLEQARTRLITGGSS